MPASGWVRTNTSNGNSPVTRREVLMNKIKQEIALGLTILVISFFFFGYYDVLEIIVEWSIKHEQYEVDEIISTLIVLVFLLFIFSVRRLRESVDKAKELQQALKEIKTLKGVIPICAYCKKIRDEEGVWNQLEVYIHSHSDVDFSHGMCPVCYKEEMDELEITKQKIPEQEK